MQNDSFNDELDNDRTVFSYKELHVSLVGTNGKVVDEFAFADSFTAGRSSDNDIVIIEGDISRRHLKVERKQGEWWVHNLGSANGVYIHGSLVKDQARLSPPVSVALGRMGIALKIQPPKQQAPKRKRRNRTTGSDVSADVTQKISESEMPVESRKETASGSQPRHDLSEEQIKSRLLEQEEAEDAGDYTKMVRRIIREDRTHHSKGYKKVIWSLAILFVIAVGLVGYQQMELSKAKNLALDMFYDIKTMEVQLSQAEIALEKQANAVDDTLDAIRIVELEVGKEKLKKENERIRKERERIQKQQKAIAAEKERLKKEREKLEGMKTKYRAYVKQAKSWRFKFPKASRYEEELIARVARDFGESELELPQGFVGEVRKYIGYWQNTKRMQKAMKRLEKQGYTDTIVAALKKEGLPPHLFYLPLQESNYNHRAIGPKTRWGIAKGAWQFIPGTAREFGLKTGPLADTREYDPEDERFNFDKAARAGAKYLKFIYSTESQASGLLVIAGYNYGQPRINKNIRKMPNNPRDRNFWKFIQQYKIPKETYDYVFYIFAAAVIGQDPKHFGFKFTPPFLTATDKAKK